MQSNALESAITLKKKFIIPYETFTILTQYTTPKTTIFVLLLFAFVLLDSKVSPLLAVKRKKDGFFFLLFFIFYDVLWYLICRVFVFCFLMADVFRKFVDEEGEFKSWVSNDVEGLLNLYEASNFAVHGEEILEKALEFCSLRLEFLTQGMTNSFSMRVKEALKIPISKTLTRLGARKFMSMYQEEESHKETLLNFAKLDFNLVQKIHQKELNKITRLVLRHKQI